MSNNSLVGIYRGENDFNFRKLWVWGLRISAVLVVISIGSLFFRGLNLGIEFRGGTSFEVKAPGVTVEDARAAMSEIGEAEAKIQTIGTETMRVQGTSESIDKQAEVRAVLARLANVPPSDVTVNTVGPSWGGEVTASALRAMVLFFIAVIVFLTFALEFKMAIATIIAVIHDVIISVGVYSVFQFEVTPATVIAFLTILGFSIYDTVVVYDKVKENEARVGLSSRMTYTDMMQLSMNQVLMRSLSTSLVALLPVIAMLFIGSFLLGAVTLEEFSIALAVGMFVGAYSSIFVAAPVVAWIKEREPRNRQIRARLEAQAVSAAGTAAAADEGDLDGDGDEATVGSTTAASATARTAAQYGSGSTVPPRPRKKTKKR